MVGFTCIPTNVWLPPVPTHPAGELTLVKVEVDFLSCPRFPQGHWSLCLWEWQIIELVLNIHLLYVLIRHDFSLWAEGQGDNLYAHLLWILKWKYWFPKGQWGCSSRNSSWHTTRTHLLTIHRQNGYQQTTRWNCHRVTGCSISWVIHYSWLRPQTRNEEAGSSRLLGKLRQGDPEFKTIWGYVIRSLRHTR